MSEATIIYDGKETVIKITTGVLYRFECAGFNFDDFATPARQIQAQVALLGAALDPKAPLDQVADKLPPLDQVLTAVTAALDVSGLNSTEEDAPEGND